MLPRRLLFALALFVAFAAPASSQNTTEVEQDTARAVEPYREPAHAMALSWLLPGAGHLYAGEKGNGYLLLGSYLAGAGMFVTPLVKSSRCVGSCEYYMLGYGGLALSLAAGIAGIVDSPRAAERTNIRNGYIHKPVKVGIGPDGSVELAITASLPKR